MALRDIPYADLTSAFLLRDLPAATLQQLPAAFEEVLRHRREPRRQPGSLVLDRRVARTQVARLASAHLHHADDSVNDTQLILAAAAFGLDGLPASLTIAGSRCVIITAHAVLDGAGSVELIHDLLDAANGLSLPVDEPAARFPVLRALRSVRPKDVREFLGSRVGPGNGDEATPSAPEPAPPAAEPGAASAAFRLDAGDLALVRKYKEPNRQGRATVPSRLCSLVVATLRDVHTGTGDMPVNVSTNLRHLAGGHVEGNFIFVNPIGTLNGDTWGPGAIAARLVEMMQPAAALSLVTATTRGVVRAALRRPRPAAQPNVTVSLIATQRALPEGVRPASITVGALGESSSTFVFSWQLGTDVYLSVWDTSGQFDLGRFEGRFREIVAERAAIR